MTLTQNQALNTVLFLYKVVLKNPLGIVTEVTHAQRTQHIPMVFTQDGVHLILQHLSGTHLLVASLLHDSGLQLLEAFHLRVKDGDFENQITQIFLYSLVLPS
ncbi:MAG: hypothetical protein H3C35_12820 [Bacteroidetes bacterium]|nr:hypothetical protein [Bacteroidota bacterium]